MEYIDEELIEETNKIRSEKTKKQISKPRFKKWMALAACFLLVFVAVFFINRNLFGNNKVILWTKDMKAEEYFKYCDSLFNDRISSDSLADYAPPYEEQRIFTDMRESFERNQVIPLMKEYPLFYCEGAYLEDSSIYSITMSWHQREENYSDLTIRAGYEEIPEMTCCIVVETDDNGRIITPAVTVTERDGILISATKNLSGNKTLTFENETGWYQIEGSWNDSYEDMVKLLDWIWEHPLDFSLFTKEKGSEYQYFTLEECPDAFAGYLPEKEIGEIKMLETTVVLKDGKENAFEGHWYNDEEKEQLHWCIKTEPDYYDKKNCRYQFEDLTQELISDTLKNESSIAFVWDELYIKVYTKYPDILWKIVSGMKAE